MYSHISPIIPMFYVLTIESIEVLNTSGDGQIFGEVMLEFHGYGLDTIYRRTIANPETKFAGDFLTLTGPSCEYKCDSWILYVSLYDGDDQHDIAVGEIDGYIRYMDNSMNQPQSYTLTGRYGAVSIRYNVFRRPVLCNIGIVLPDEKEGAARVFGTIVARQYLGEEEEPPTSVTLFWKSAGESVPVLPGGAIPMDRCVVGLPVGSCITVEVELRRAGDGAGGGDELIASGWVDFGDDEKWYVSKSEIISGSCGQPIQVSAFFQGW